MAWGLYNVLMGEKGIMGVVQKVFNWGLDEEKFVLYLRRFLSKVEGGFLPGSLM